jgi:predicted phosphodiesterase
MNFSADNIYAIGDTHTLDYVDILTHYDFCNFVLIHMGDAGEGFDSRSLDESRIDALISFCEERNGHILTVRGNHSNPEFYKPGHWASKSDRVQFVPDYTYHTINGSKFLFVGGATSIDRAQRTVGFDYWLDEGFALPDDYINTLASCDVLVTHSCPIAAPPHDGLSRISGWFRDDPTLREELIAERQKIQQLYEQVNPKINLYGHFHETLSERIDGTWFRCLDINEVLDITRDI